MSDDTRGGKPGDKPDDPSKDLTGLNELPFATEDASGSGSQAQRTLEAFETLDELPQAPDHQAPSFEAPSFDDSAFASPEVSPSEGASLGGDLPPPDRFPEPASAAPASSLHDHVAQVIPGKATVPASFPFSLLIEGELAEDERARLVDILTRENMGVREVDLEPQFAAGRVLIPRISEYAGILLVQALRATRARIKLGPSDTIFATDATRTEPDEVFTLAESRRMRVEAAESMPAERIPVTADPVLAAIPRFELIDTVTASAALRTTAVEAQKSTEFQETLEALQLELKQKARLRGAAAIVAFRVQLIPLGDPSRYRLVVLGSAIRAQNGPENDNHAARHDEIPPV